MGELRQTRDRVTEYRIVRAGDLVRNPKNWRTHPEAQRRGLEALLDKVGSVDVLRTFVLPDGRLCLFDGHLRADIREDEDVRVLVTDLTQEEADLVLATFDPVSAMAGADLEMLGRLLDDVRLEVPEDVLATLEALMPAVPPPPGGDDDPAPVDKAGELREQWGAVLGQVWEIPSKSVPGRCHRVMCGDSLDPEVIAKVLDGQVPDGVWSDAPYGIAIVSGGSIGGAAPFGGKTRNPGGKMVKTTRVARVLGDDTTDVARESFGRLWEMFPASLHCWWGANHYGDCLPASPCWIVWDKENSGNFADVELAWCSHDGAARLFRHMWNGMLKASERGEQRLHATQKPVALFEWFAQKFLPGAGKVWLDPFAGSGISLLGAERLGQIACCVELSEAYVAVILERAKNAGLEPRLVGENPF